ncbi:nidogen-2 [Tamandua tetradactyla]|uniref:nidogen-2 n=1 Tax=Tamandua tetradactyla TaxID=48850 RepID=UPI0040542E78
MPGGPAGGRPALLQPLALLLLVSRAAALHPSQLFPRGESWGDQLLREGDDESSAAVKLATPVRFYEAQFHDLYVGTNGVISTQDFPRETQYVDDDFPTDFPVIAPFLADLDTSRGRGRVLFREDMSPAVLALASRYVRTGFPRSAARFTAAHAFLATWEQVGAYEEVARGAQPSGRLNTFQAVLASDKSDTYALFLYPANGLQFFGTRPKESYNAQLELPARVGFCRGETDDLKREGLYFSLTSTEQSVKNLYQLSNLGVAGVWAFHIGSASPMANVVPAAVPTRAHPPAPLGPSLGHVAAPEDADMEGHGEHHEDSGVEYEDPPSGPGTAGDGHSGTAASTPSAAGPMPPAASLSPRPPLVPGDWPPTPEARWAVPGPQTRAGEPLGEAGAPDADGLGEPPGPTGAAGLLGPLEATPPYPGGGAGPSGAGISAAPPDGEARLPHWPAPSRWSEAAEEGEAHASTQVFRSEAPGRGTCSQHHGQCSRRAFCTDYATGFCCHCQSGFYGNGRQCLPEGAPLRVNGKVSGRLRVGATPVHFAGVDLHAYVVAGDGRVSTAISHVPPPAAHALLPLAPPGGLLGWLFALEKPGARNGFSLAGASFIHDMEVVFHPGEERVRVTQTAEALDSENYLSIKTDIRGEVPYVPENFTARIAPYKELYHYSDSAVTSTSSRDYTLMSGAINHTRSYSIQQNITFQACRHARRHQAGPSTQQLSADRVFALYDEKEKVLRFAVTNQIGSVEVNPCYDGSHMCDVAARCLPGPGMDYTCECSPGFQGDGQSCMDVDECASGFPRCGPNSVCINLLGSYRCECQSGYELASDRRTCNLTAPGPDPCVDGSQSCVPASQAQCTQLGDGTFHCACLPGYAGDGHQCTDVDECSENRCHPAATCYNTPGSFSCHCQAGYHGDGLQCLPEPTRRPATVCERWRASLLELYGGAPRDDQFVPRCDARGYFAPLQCHGKSDFCWCVDQDGREAPGTAPACIPTVTPPTARPTPRPDVTPPSVGTFLLYAQGQQIGHLPLNGTGFQKDAAKTLLSLHGSIVVGIDYDCRERMVYWTDVAGRTISRASLEPGAEPETVINSGLISPEGLVIDHFRRTMYWTDSVLDKIERARLDGAERRVLFYTDLVNPRAIAVDPVRGNLYWTDWNREAPKIETSSLDGENRRILVNKDIGLPNGLTFDPFSKLLCWADAGTKKLECTLPDGTGRRVIQNNLNYPFSIVSYANHFYHTDWRRDGVIAVNKDDGQLTDEYLPEQRSHLYGITAVYPYCPGGRK